LLVSASKSRIIQSIHLTGFMFLLAYRTEEEVHIKSISILKDVNGLQ